MWLDWNMIEGYQEGLLSGERQSKEEGQIEMM